MTIIEIALLILVLGLIIAIIWYKKKVLELSKSINLLKIDGANLLSEKKSKETLLGHATEKLIPFSNQFKHDPRNIHFLGQPIDYIAFDEDGIHFIEIKFNTSQTSKRQRDIKKLIKEGKVYWELIRVDKDLNDNKEST